MKLACVHCDRPVLICDHAPIGWTRVLPIQPCNLAILKQDMPEFDGTAMGLCPVCHEKEARQWMPEEKPVREERLLF